jgi:broad specificity phosphatase PhoE
MKISLIRHGRPVIDMRSRIEGRELGRWLNAYDEAAIDPNYPPPEEVRHSIADCRRIVTSPARRAVTSAALLAPTIESQVSADAAEAPLPSRITTIVRMNPRALIVVARILWLAGLASASEGKDEVRARALRLAAELEQLARVHDHVGLVGHGYMIRFLQQPLEKLGWRCIAAREMQYWSRKQFEKKAQL